MSQFNRLTQTPYIWCDRNLKTLISKFKVYLKIVYSDKIAVSSSPIVSLTIFTEERINF